VNDRKQLAAVATVQRRQILDRLMEGGVTISIRPALISRYAVTIGPDTTIYPQVVIEDSPPLEASASSESAAT